MPELPDVTVYVEALRERVVGARLERLRLVNAFVLRSVDPPLSDVVGRAVTGVSRLGKRLVLPLPDERFVVIHLMIAGRLHWKAAGEGAARASRRREEALLGGHAGAARRLVGAPAPRGGRRVPGGRARFPPRHGRARPLPPAVSRLRRARAAYRVRGERDQLLPA